jgi:hypothetical protein
MYDSDKPSGYSLFCDDVRQEVGGKLSYIGVYFGAMFVQSFPVTFPKFVVSVTFCEPPEMTMRRTWAVPIKIFIPGHTDPIATAEIPPASEQAMDAALKSDLPPDPDVPKIMMGQVAFAMTPLVLEGPGRIKVRAFYRDDLIIRMGSLRIERMPAETIAAPTASPPPS